MIKDETITINAEDIENRIKELVAQREKFIAMANVKIGWFDGRISLLRELLSKQEDA